MIEFYMETIRSVKKQVIYGKQELSVKELQDYYRISEEDAAINYAFCNNVPYERMISSTIEDKF
jgi:hypothetical protein